MTAHVVGHLAIEGRMARRLLVKATVDADLVVPLLPPRLALAGVGGRGRAFVGVCLLRVADLRPGRVPAALGRSFDGLAYRVAVTTAHGVVDEPPRPDHASVLGDDEASALRFDSAFLVRDVPVRFTPAAAA